MNSSDLDIVAAIAAEEASARAVETIADTMEIDEQGKPANIESATAEPKDTKDTIDEAINKDKEGDAKEEDYDSSDLELSSSSGEDDDDDDDDDEKDEESSMNDGWGDNGEEDVIPMAAVRTANEVTNFVVEKPNFDIKPNMTLLRVGHIYEVIDKVIIIQSEANTGAPALDMGTLFTYSDHSVMGEVFETFGPVFKPFYSVLFNSAEEIDASKAVVGSEVFYVPEYERTQVVPTEELRKMKYTDASNMYDEEISASDEEFSDDEAEREHKRLKKKTRGKSKVSNTIDHNERAPAKAKPHHPPQKRQRFYDEPDDFDSALAAYEQSSNNSQAGSSVVPGLSQNPVSFVPRRQVQSYADITEGVADPFVNQPAAPPATQHHNTTAAAATTPAYQAPEDLVRALYVKKEQKTTQQAPQAYPARPNNPPPPTNTTTTTTTTTTIPTATSAPAPQPHQQSEQSPQQHEQPQQQQQPEEGSARAVLLAMLQAGQTPQ